MWLTPYASAWSNTIPDFRYQLPAIFEVTNTWADRYGFRVLDRFLLQSGSPPSYMRPGVDEFNARGT